MAMTISITTSINAQCGRGRCGQRGVHWLAAQVRQVSHWSVREPLENHAHLVDHLLTALEFDTQSIAFAAYSFEVHETSSRKLRWSGLWTWQKSSSRNEHHEPSGKHLVHKLRSSSPPTSATSEPRLRHCAASCSSLWQQTKTRSEALRAQACKISCSRWVWS